MQFGVLLSLLCLYFSALSIAEEGYCPADDKLCRETAEKVKVAKGANSAGKPPEVSFSDCADRTDQCGYFVSHDECNRNPGWMIINCPKSCNACHLRDPKIRCDRTNLNISTEPIYQPDDMNAMFENIEVEFGDRYGITYASRDPYIVTFDNFLTDEECDALITTVDGCGGYLDFCLSGDLHLLFIDCVICNWERSTDSGHVNEFGETGRTLSTGRTSSNAWCRKECLDNPHVQTALHKIEEVTRIPSTHYESFQILQYELGQKYNLHHDMSARQNSLSSGPRILTFFLYLSDVEEGGETNFPYAHVSVKPQRGKAVLWPSVMNNDLSQQDYRTNHEAKPVIKGVKYAANSWIHSYNFEKSNLWGCTGAFDYL